jgi:hypothetical protein
MENKETEVKQRGYYVVCLAAFVLECASTMYISTVGDRSIWMVFFIFSLFK